MKFKCLTEVLSNSVKRMKVNLFDPVLRTNNKTVSLGLVVIGAFALLSAVLSVNSLWDLLIDSKDSRQENAKS